MSNDLMLPREQEQQVKVNVQRGSSGIVFGLGMIGAWIFYIGRARDFREGVAGFFKGLVWPVFLVYELLGSLHPIEPASPPDGKE